MFKSYYQARKQILLRWLEENYPIGSYVLNVKLGMPNSLHFPYSRYGNPKGKLFNLDAVADAIVLLPNEVHIIKLSITPNYRIIRKLLKCEEAFKKTERFKNWWHLPIIKILLTENLNPLLLDKGGSLGITFYILQIGSILNPDRIHSETIP